MGVDTLELYEAGTFYDAVNDQSAITVLQC